MVLVPEVVAAVAPTPVIAAGGIGSGRQLAAAIALGAQGGWAGSIWLTTVEGQVDAAVTPKLLRATSSDTVRSRAISGKPARRLRSTWAWDDREEPPGPACRSSSCSRRRRSEHPPLREETGRDDLVTSPVGQIVGAMNELKPVDQVLAEIGARLEATQELRGGAVGQRRCAFRCPYCSGCHGVREGCGARAVAGRARARRPLQKSWQKGPEMLPLVRQENAALAGGRFSPEKSFVFLAASALGLAAGCGGTVTSRDTGAGGTGVSGAGGTGVGIPGNRAARGQP